MTENNPRSGNNLHIEVGSINAHGHVVISGGDAQVSGHTRDDDRETHTIVVGGVKTTPQKYESLKQSLDKVDKAIEQTPLPPDDIEAAKSNSQNLKTIMTSQEKPNGTLLVQVSEQLIKFSPKIAGTVVGLFTNPLAGEIVELAGERAIRFYKELLQKYPEMFKSQPGAANI